MSEIQCPRCQTLNTAQRSYCVSCGYALTSQAAATPLAASEALSAELSSETAQVPPSVQAQAVSTSSYSRSDFNLEFTGNSQEYFRIWVINWLLTIVTLGVYFAWAKVRTRRYFYANTFLDGHPFEYLAKPVPILKGHIIIGVFALLYYASGAFMPLLTGMLGFAGAFFMPYFIYKSLRFRANYSSYRNLRFHFSGDTDEAYTVYWWLVMATPFTLGLLYPYVLFTQVKYTFGNFNYANSRSSYSGTQHYFYKVLILSVFLPLLVVIGGSVALVFMFPEFVSDLILYSSSSMMVIVVYAIYVTVFLLVQQFIATSFFNYNLKHWEVGDVRFSSTLNPWHVLGIRISNAVAIIMSLGLLIPWARIRYINYMFSHMTLHARSLEDFEAGYQANAKDGVLGDAAADIFDFDGGFDFGL